MNASVLSIKSTEGHVYIEINDGEVVFDVKDFESLNRIELDIDLNFYKLVFYIRHKGERNKRSILISMDDIMVELINRITK